MKTKFVKAVTEDKLVLQGLFYEPEQSTKRAVLHIHGMSGNFYENSFLDSMAKIFTENNWSFLAPNNRGHDFIADFVVKGEKEQFKRIGNAFEKFEECVLDIKPWIDYLKNKGYTEIILQGHSLGCSKVVYYLVKTKDQRIKKLVLAAPADMVGLAEADKNFDKLVILSKQMVKEGRGEELLLGKIWEWFYLSANTFLDFSLRGNPIDVFNIYDKEKASLLGEINIPTLAFFGSIDESAVIPVEKALEIIKNKAKNCPKFDTFIIENASHGYFGHEEETAKEILKYL